MAQVAFQRQLTAQMQAQMRQQQAALQAQLRAAQAQAQAAALQAQQYQRAATQVSLGLSVRQHVIACTKRRSPRLRVQQPASSMQIADVE